MPKPATPEEWWGKLLTGHMPEMPMKQARHVFSLVPGSNRCKFCNAPASGKFVFISRLLGRGPSRLTTQLCHMCQVIASEHLGGAEIEVALLFADVRGSTKLAEGMKPTEFSQLISRFFSVSSNVLLHSNAWVDKLVGDQVIGMYLPGFLKEPAELVAINAAKALLHDTGHADPDGPWIGVGVGVHCGTAFIGTVGSKDGATDITVLGDVPNVAARLSSAAGPGEILVSHEAFIKANAPVPPHCEERSLELKGKSQPMTVHVLNCAAQPTTA